MQRKNCEAVAAISRYLISYALRITETNSFPWALYCTAWFLHSADRGEEALATFRYLLSWTKKFASATPSHWYYRQCGNACLYIGRDRYRNNPSLAVDFLTLAVANFTRAKDAGRESIGDDLPLSERDHDKISRRLSACQSKLRCVVD
ncbi:hypothetical protein F5Y08DRAFT_133321 [Xylaria arbuscula]|nr:hypothetical protein F5Y08DRAFT_133321 [Xylaria arbuscula]